MPVVNYERAWLQLKAHIDGKPSHGTRDLLAQMGRIEVACEIPEAEEGFDARPLPRSKPAGDDPRELRERLSAASS